MDPYFEIIRPNPAPRPVRLAIFDHDGTVSLLRSGWTEIMIGVVLDCLPRFPLESDVQVRRIASDLIHSTNGQPTLVQMDILDKMIHARGGPARGGGAYKQIFITRLEAQVRPRLAEIRTGHAPGDKWQMPGVRRLLEALRARQIHCYLASGSDDADVREEVAALGLSGQFTGIYGATPEVETSSKAAVFARLASEYALAEHELLVVGDGREEVRLGRDLGGVIIGVACAENGEARPEGEQRERLIAAGADVIVSDLRPLAEIQHYLFADSAA